MPLRRPPQAQLRGQRGAAALIVVMLLFFVISLVAAYTSRNLIFEQRTATNQYRSTQAMEAAEAGVEWAIAQLNAGRITNSCEATTALSNESFRQRYLVIDSTTGNVSGRAAVSPGVTASVRPFCVFNGSGGGAAWNCVCPQANALPGTLSSPTGAGTSVAPAFIVRFRPASATPPRPDLIQLESNSCTRLGADCLNFNTSRGSTGDGVAAVRVTLALRGALNRVPVAPLTVMGAIDTIPSGLVLSLTNEDARTNGVTVHTAGALPGGGLSLTGVPGSAGASTTISNDTTLLPVAQTGFTATDLRFANFFGMGPQTYRSQPGMPVLDCSSGCNAAAIAGVAQLNPGRPVWLAGSSGTVTVDADLGTTTQPVLLIVEGDLQLGSGATVRGLIYHRAKPGGGNTTWNVTGTATLLGAAVMEGGLSLTGSSATSALVYDPAVLKAVRVGMGSFIRVPGSWRDF